MLSIILVIKFGLVGIAVGTLLGMSYRMLYFVWYISHNILNRSMVKFLKRLSVSSVILVISPMIVKVLDTTGSPSIILWIKNGVVCLLVYGAITLLVNVLIDKNTTIGIMKRKKRNI